MFCLSAERNKLSELESIQNQISSLFGELFFEEGSAAQKIRIARERKINLHAFRTTLRI